MAKYTLVMPTTPFNQAFHDHMMSLGAEYQRVPAFWEDTGTPESGPDLSGCQAHDLYQLGMMDYAVFEDGTADRAPCLDVEMIIVTL